MMRALALVVLAGGACNIATATVGTPAVTATITATITGTATAAGSTAGRTKADRATADDSPAAPASPLPRERLRLDHGWRFHRGEPAGSGAGLDYDIRPQVDDNGDGKDADARPDAAAHVGTAAGAVLKPWILPTGNALLPADRQQARPPGHPGGDHPFVQPGFDDSTWQAVTLPHDWAIGGPFLLEGPHGGMGRLPSWGIGWYRRQLDIPASDRGRRIALEFDGAMSYAAVWCNGQLLGGWPYGYNGWEVDLTDCLRYGGRNQIAVRLDNPPASARWYPGGGLYRSVWLRRTGPVHVAQWSTRVTTPSVSPQTATVQVRSVLRNDTAATRRVIAQVDLHAVDAQGMVEKSPVLRGRPMAVTLPAHGTAPLQATLELASPRMWGPPPTQQPALYRAVTTVRDGTTLSDGSAVPDGAAVLDRMETTFGIRDIHFDPDRGFIINGEHVRLQGVNNHHDLGALGAAFNVRAAQRQLEILQQMGANAIRMAHNPPAPELLDLADRMGMLVVNEVFDSWEMKKTPLDFHLVFPDWHEQDLRAMLRRDRNHPSVILWSIGNEVGEQYSGDDGARIARRLRDIVREEDDRPVTSAMNYAKPDMALPAELDVIGLNYQGEGIRQSPEFEGTERIRTPPQYAAFHARHPDKAIIGTETASTLSSRGEYLFPVTEKASSPVRDGQGGDPVRHHVSAYDLYAVDFGVSPDTVFAALDRHPYVAGEFVWTGFDYLGEPTPYYSSRSSYSGIIDLAGFPKDRYYLYQSRWRPDLPMAHLLPHWTWPGREGHTTPVHVFTSGDEAELFVNGVSAGRRLKQPGSARLRWDDVVYQPGELRVQAWKNGQPWATDQVRTANAAARLEATTERATLLADGRDLAFVAVHIHDAHGVPVPHASTPITFNVEGPAELVATDNGDPTDMTVFPSATRAAFNGRALAILRALPGASGTVTVRATAEGLAPSTTTLTLHTGSAP